MIFDAHNHLQDSRLDPHRVEILAELARIGLGAAVVNGTQECDWPAVASLAEAYEWVMPSYGLHPWYVGGRSTGWLGTLIERLDAEAAQGRPHGVGEIGLDRWKRPHDINDQEEVFLAQLSLAAERNLPVTIHCLEAWGRLSDLLHQHALPARGFLLHAYGGPPEWIEPLSALGAYFSFNSACLKARTASRRTAFTRVPPERLLVETDAPSLPPAPGLTRFHLPPSRDGSHLQHPASVADAHRALAGLLGLEETALRKQVAANFQRFFGRGKELPGGRLPWNPCQV